MSEVRKPLPIVTLSDRPFWEGAKRHELMAYKCLNCDTFYYPAIHCVTCDRPQMGWIKVSGKGTVHTFVVYHQVYHAGWKGDIPYNVAWIKLDEGPLLLSNIVGCGNEEIFIGMRVEVVFDEVTEDVTLHRFKAVR
jgi:hypothetical protein